jgi:hypothetical protein
MRGRPGPSWTVQVKVPPDKAYAYVADIGRHAEWSFGPDSMTITADNPGPAKVGSTFKAEGNLMGRNKSTVTVTALDPPKTVEFESQDGSGINGHQFTFTAQDGGTLITRQMFGIKSPFYGPLLFMLAKGAIDKDYNGALANLKTKLESGA